MTNLKSIVERLVYTMAEVVNRHPRILIYHAGQCDPKKCTGLRLERMEKAKILNHIRQIPRDSVVLNPIAEVAFSVADVQFVRRHGIVALDCSWRKAESIFHEARQGIQRALPYLLAANPVNTYKPIKLSTAEALAAALYIVGMEGRAKDLLSVFKWGSNFITLNKEWLDAYAECNTSSEVVEIQSEIMEAHQK
ncbi:MAG: DUF367 family protein [Promethearchaeia archaeon]